MPTLGRILKYTPAVVLGLLVVAWVVSIVIPCGASLRFGNIVVAASAYPRGTASILLIEGSEDLPVVWAAGHARFDPFRRQSLLGTAAVSRDTLRLPFLVLVVGILPLSIGPFTSFRFRLWHYLVYTALIALELVYYLRWQG